MSNDPKRTTPTGLVTYANDFRKTALAANEQFDTTYRLGGVASVSVMYLVAHSIELSIKAYLLHKGQSLEQTKKIGHDLCRALKKAKELGIGDIVQITDDEINALQLLNNLYSKKELNYIVTGVKQFPVFDPLNTLNGKLLHGVAERVHYPPQLLVP